MKTLGIGNKESDSWTRVEYNKLIEEAGMIDINTKMKEFIQEEVREFAQGISVMEFSTKI